MSKEDIAQLCTKRSSVKGRITKFKNYVTNLDNLDETLRSSDQVNELSLRLEKFTEMFSKFDDLQTELELLNSDNLQAELDVREEIEQEFYSLTVTAQSLIEKLNIDNKGSTMESDAGSRCHHGHSEMNFRLPLIKISNFDGSYFKWLEFRDTYTSLIHDNDAIKPIHKFHYLLSYLEAEAAQVISNLEVSDSNYIQAWRLLCERYNNNKQLITNHLNSLLNLQPLGRESAKSIRHITDHISKNLRALNTLGLPTDKWDALIIHIMASKLDSKTIFKWEEYKNNSCGDIPSLKEFYKFLKGRADILESIQQSSSISNEKYIKKRDFKTQKFPVKSFVVSAESGPASLSCVVCSGSHRIYDCSSFRSKSVADRIAEAARLKLCSNCLRKGHLPRQCRLGPCSICRKYHNTLLHKVQTQAANTSTEKIQDNKLVSLPISSTSHILLSTAIIKIRNPLTDIQVDARALLDCGSQCTIITEDLKHKLGLTSQPTCTNIVGVGNLSLSSLPERCNIEINSKITNFKINASCLILQQISGYIPHSQINISQLDLPKNIQLADPHFSNPAVVDILIGADIFWTLIEPEQIVLGPNKPIIQRSKLGWLLSGPIAINYFSNNNKKVLLSSDIYCNHITVDNLNNELTKFWELEHIPQQCEVKTDTENECEDHFVKNTYRNEEGRFCVRLPLISEPDCLGNSFQLAKKCFLSLEKRFRKNPELKQLYTQFIYEYLHLGHLSISDNRIPDIAYFIPHHAVLKPTSESTKLRVVFNGSAPTTSGYSVNDLQMVGPTIQDSLFNILIRFRLHKYVLSGDVEKMYRQCEVQECDRNLQLILWRDCESEPLKILKLNTVTYGFASASFLSTRCLWQLGEECSDNKIKTIIQKDFLVDDLLTGSDSEDELHKIKKSVETALSAGCFNLRKYRSNLPSVLNMENISSSDSQRNLIISSSSHTLGVGWNPNEDYIHFPTNYANKNDSPTKRSILSDSCKVFDPLGLLSPLTIIPKILIQKLWMNKIDWDEPVSTDIQHSWQRFVDNLKHLYSLRIPRHVLCNSPKICEIHCFSDSSQSAYASCVFLRSIDNNGMVTVRLLCAKAKVAPIKATTIPRLELCAALLGSQLTNAVCKGIRHTITRRFYWSDSTIVLAWLRSNYNNLKTFVANRVSAILDLTNDDCWRYVPSALNPADLASRGVDIQKLSDSKLWWNGPNFLTEPESNWPILNSNSNNELPELKINSTFLCTNKNLSEPLIDFNRYSNINLLQRSFAYIFRFIHNCKNPTNKKSGVLQPEELKLSFNTLVKFSQNDSFSSELKTLRSKNHLSASNSLLPLSPFIDEDDILRVGGRLQNSQYPFEKRHPILLHSNHKFTKLIFEREHLRLLHAGPQLLLATIRQSIWPVSGRHLARSTIRNCIICRKLSGRTPTPLMGSLPSQRITPDYPFISVSADFAGPFLITDRKGRGCKITKCYLCIFVCMRYKCVHLEAVSELSKDAFILSLRRFISRRGKPLEIFCDNGRNFVAASKEIGQFLSSHSNDISDFSSKEGIKFRFQPAYAPHFGGLFEAGVRSAKHHLKRILGNTHLLFEELATLFSQVEAILNSRPLSPLSSSPNDLQPLTPGHFLIGRALTSLPAPSYDDVNFNRLDRFQRLETLRQHFWKRWQLEYISELQQRSKWRVPATPMQVGELVLLKEDNVSPMNWRLGRIVKLFPGSDGCSRVAEVNTSRGLFRRGVKYLCPLLENNGYLEAEASKAREYVPARSEGTKEG